MENSPPFFLASFPTNEISDIRYDLFDNSPLLCSPADIQPGLRPTPTSSDLFFPHCSSHVLLPLFQEKPQLELLLPGQVLLEQGSWGFLQSNYIR